MLDISAYDRVVSLIYESALVPAQWDIALTSMISFFGQPGWGSAMVLWERIDPPMGRFIGAAGVHDLARHAYLGSFAGQQDWSVRGHDMPIGRVFHSDEIVPREQFRGTPFCQNFLQPWGLEVALIGSLDRQGADHMAIVCPGPPDVDPGDLYEAVVRLTPHFQRAARISRRIGEADLRAATATELLDHSPYCVIALDDRLRVLLANRQAQALLGLGEGAVSFRSQLIPEDPAIGRQLVDMAAGRGCERSVTFTATTRGGVRVMISALAVPADQGRQLGGGMTDTALMIVAGQRMDMSEKVIGALQDGFRLTDAEARLAAFLIEGSGVQGYAGYRGVSVEAGKYLLKSIYAKTGLSNQTELVALLREAPLGWGSPLTSGTLN